MRIDEISSERNGSTMKAAPDREQGLQLCMQAMETELRRLEAKKGPID